GGGSRQKRAKPRLINPPCAFMALKMLEFMRPGALFRPSLDTQGLPHAIAVTTAEVTDRQGALLALERNKQNVKRLKGLLCDRGYIGDPFAQGVQEMLGRKVKVQIAKRSELHTFKVMPKRWIVERSFAWLEKNRRLWKNCERRLNTSLQMIHLALLLRRL
ncbi:IS5 family transposase, partial [Xanthomonas populi]|uniref:IS5 family transposase n=1 Tax=Xanthomonas populi TaxID=53414 RepID=UPI001FC9A587